MTLNKPAKTVIMDFFRHYRKPMMLIISWLLIMNVFEWVVSERFELESHDDVYDWINEDSITCRNNYGGFFGIHHRWDSGFYIDIVKNGYSFVPDKMSNTSFFPLYPLFIGFFYRVLGLPLIFSAWIISNFAVLFACLIIYKLLKIDFDEKLCIRAVFFMLIFPGSFYFTVIYSESIYLLTSALSFYYIIKRKWWAAGFAGMLCALARPVGFLILIPMAIEYLSERKKNVNILSFLLVPLGPAGLMFYHKIKLGNAFVFFNSGEAVGHNFGEVRIFQFNRINAPLSAYINVGIDIVIVLAVIACIIVLIRNRTRLAYVIYCMFAFFLPILSMGKLNGTNRYAVVLFPLFLVPALISKRSESFNMIYGLISILVLGLLTTLFVQFYWSG